MISSDASAKITRLLLACCAIQIAAAIYFCIRTDALGYLPAPFSYDKSDTFMDFFHPLYWADDSGRYTIWGSVYPPINFLFLKAVRWLIVGPTNEADAFSLRDQAATMMPVVILLFAGSFIFVFCGSLWQHFTRAQRVLLFVATVLSTPVLFTLERGNLIILAVAFVTLALTRSNWTGIFAIGMLVNIKPYFALFIIVLFLTRRIREASAAFFCAGGIFLITGIVLDENFLTFVQNLLGFSQDEGLFSAREVLSLPSSISAFTYVLRTYYAQGGQLSIGPFDTGMLMTLIEAIKWLAVLAMFAALGMASRRIPRDFALAASTVAISNLGVWVGGYSYIFYAALIPVLLRMQYRNAYLFLVAIIFAPLDGIPLLTENIGNQFAYISQATVSVDWQLSMGSLLRPAINFLLMIVIAWEIFQRYSQPSWSWLLRTLAGPRRFIFPASPRTTP